MNVVAHSDMGCMLFIQKGAGEKLKYLVPIKSVPATGAAPAQLDATELDSKYKQYVLDRQDTPAFDFQFNATIKNYFGDDEKGTKGVSFYLDGHSQFKFGIVYPDGSGCIFQGEGVAYKDAITAGSVINGVMSIAVSYKEDVQDMTDEVDINSIPIGRFSPFISATDVQMEAIGNIEIADDEVKQLTVETYPTDATVTATSSEITVATVGVNGKILTITGVGAGQTIINVTAAKAGMASATQFFVVTIK